FLFRNGIQFCEVIEPESSLSPNSSGVLLLVTAQRVIQMHGDVFELVTSGVRFPVTIRHSHVAPEGWGTLCALSTSKSA
ncbi:hypothetical protein, partial [Luteolibacter soli]